MSQNEIKVVLSKEISKFLTDVSGFDSSNFIDTRPLQPFGPTYDYASEPAIEVNKLPCSDRLLYVLRETEAGMEMERLVKWLAIVNHYGPTRVYDHHFMHIFFPHVEKSMLKVFISDDIESPEYLAGDPMPRVFGGTKYNRQEFINEFLSMFEDYGFEFE